MERLDRINGNLVLTQKRAGLCYGTDALLLAAYMRGRKNGRAVELGAGTGVVSLLAASHAKYAHFYAVEVQSEYADLCARNVHANGMDGLITTVHADVRELRAEQISAEADAVYANPPYLRLQAGSRNLDDGKYIARHEVYGTIGDFCEAARRLLKHGGLFYAVYRPDRLCDLLTAMRFAGLEPKRMTFVHDSPAHPPCLLLVEAKKGGASGCALTKPLFLRENGLPTADARYIEENGSFGDGYGKK